MSTKKSAQKEKDKSQEKRFLLVSLLVTLVLMAALYFVFRNAF
ncbi:MAG: hypothetical protein WAT92_13915 [Saprospiraceae bacterium]|nr:hypothetical protein [Saprospiraceae bacterium]